MSLLILASALLAAHTAGAAYLNASADYASGLLGPSPVQTFKSSDSTPVMFNFEVFPSSPSPDALFLAPRGTNVTKPGPYIFDSLGELIWDGSVYGESMAFSPATYQDQPVIALWNGKFDKRGFGDGHGLVLNQSYAVVANFTTTIPDAFNDFHEYTITPNGTALITIYKAEPYDLSAFNVVAGDNSGGWIINSYAQEIDIATGAAIWTWSSLDHVLPNMSFAEPGSTGTSEDNAWDYFHINSVHKDESGNYLLSARHTSAVYYVSGTDGAVQWTLGGKANSFTMGENTSFGFQHDAHFHTPKTLSIFDNDAADWTDANGAQSRGLVLNMDYTAMTAAVNTSMSPFNTTHLSRSQGNCVRQPNGNWLIGWGSSPAISEYSPTGAMLWAAQFGAGDVQGYRVARAAWVGKPTTSPRMAVAPAGAGHEVSLSWNGATQVHTWVVAGSSALAPGEQLVNATKTGFETSITVPAGTYAYLQASAVDAQGVVLGYTNFFTPDGTDAGAPTSEQGASAAAVSAASFTTGAAPAATSAVEGFGSGAPKVEVSVLLAVVGVVVAGAVEFA